MLIIYWLSSGHQGRTGLMICCYILHRSLQETADEALKHYGQTRTHDTKVCNCEDKAVENRFALDISLRDYVIRG